MLNGVLVLLAVLIPTTIGQVNTGETPATGRQAVSQTGEVSGRVSCADDGSPIAGAWVVIRRSGFATMDFKTTRSNLDGSFKFSDIKPGNYELAATVPTFVIQHYSKNGERYGLVSVSAGQAVNVNFAMVKGAIVSGTVHTEADQPLAGIAVSALRVPAPGELIWEEPAVVTDSQGSFRLVELEAGHHRLCVNTPNRKFKSIADTQHYPEQCFSGAALPGVALKDAKRIQVSVGEEVQGISFQVSDHPAH